MRIAFFAAFAIVLFSLFGCAKKAPPSQGTTKATASPTPSDKEAAPFPAASVDDIRNFRIDPAAIPREKLDTTLHVACSIGDEQDPYAASLVSGMELFCQYLDSIGQKYETQLLLSGGSNDVEIDTMKQFTAKTDGNIIVCALPNEPASAPSLAGIIASAGGYIGTIENKPDDIQPVDYLPNWIVHVSVDHVANGRASAAALFQTIGGAGTIFVLESFPENGISQDMQTGLQQALDDYPDIQVIKRQAVHKNTDETKALTMSWLKDFPDIQGIWCADDSIALDVLEVLHTTKLAGQTLVSGIGALPPMITTIENGEAAATVSFNGVLQGGYTLAMCYAAWSGLLAPAIIPKTYQSFYTPAILITANTAEEYRANYLETTPSYDFSNIWFFKAEAAAPIIPADTKKRPPRNSFLKMDVPDSSPRLSLFQ